MSCIRVGSVGIGGISRHVHLPGIERSPDLKLVAVCDIDPEALRYAQEKYGIDEAHCFTDYHDLINCPDVDAVDISTPNDVHYEVALAAAEAGKPYAVEKPIVMTGEQADHLAQVTKERGVKSMVCFSYRFKASARYAKDLIERGLIGDIYHVDMQYYQAWGLPMCNTPLVWRFEQKHTGSGALGDLGSHALDLVRFVTGKEYKRLISHTGTFVHEREKLDSSGMGKVDVDDFSNYFAEMDGGTAATFRITRFGFGRGNYQTMVTKERGVKSMVCFSYRFKASARYAKDLIERGLIGDIYHVDMQYYQAWGLPMCNTPLVWRFEQKHTGSGALGDLGSHALDLVRFVTGKEYKRLISHTGTFVHEREKLDSSGMGKVDVDDFSNYFAEMDGGTAATFRITRFGFGRGNYQTMEIYGSRGAIQYELDHAAPDVDEIYVCMGEVGQESHTFTKLPIPDKFKVDQMQSFADIILGKADGKAATIEDGRVNQHLVDAVIRSGETGEWETL